MHTAEKNMGKSQKIKGDNGFVYFITRGLILLAVGLFFDILALIIFSVKSSVWQFIISLITIIPIFYIAFISGKIGGEHTFKAAKRNKVKIKQGDKVTAAQKFIEYHWAKGLIVGGVYAFPQIVLLTLGLIMKNTILCAVIEIYNMSFYGILFSLGIIEAGAEPIKALYYIIIFAIPAIYEIGFVLRAKVLKKQQLEIESELLLFKS